ncbi:uncharacterized [Tachysurus ichikawai]
MDIYPPVASTFLLELPGLLFCEAVFEWRERDFDRLIRLGDLDSDLVLRGDFDLLCLTGDFDLDRLERRGEEDLLRLLGFLDLDLERLFLLIRDRDRLKITMDLERVRLLLLIDLDRDFRVRDGGVIRRERDCERLTLRADLERDLERCFLRESDRLDRDRERRSFATDRDLVRRPRRGDLVLDRLVLVLDLESERRLRFPDRDLDLRFGPLTDLDRDLRLSDGDLECLFCVLLFLLELETDLSLDCDLSFLRAEIWVDCFGVLERLWLDLSYEPDRDLNLDSVTPVPL